MKYTILILAAGLLVSGAPMDDVGSIAGVVKFEGKVPPATPITVAGGCHASGDEKTEEVVVKDGKLQNVLVYVKKGASGKFKPPAEEPILDQKGCIYRPHVIAIMRNQVLRIRSSDDTPHNVHILPERNKEENIPMAKPATIKRSWKIPEIGIKVKCDVHPWMGAYLHVMKNPFFAVTGEDGSFSIAGLKPGKYTLAAWHEKYGEKTAEVTVKKDGKVKAEFSFSEK